MMQIVCISSWCCLLYFLARRIKNGFLAHCQTLQTAAGSIDTVWAKVAFCTSSVHVTIHIIFLSISYFSDIQRYDKQIRSVLSEEEMEKERGEKDMMWIQKYILCSLFVTRLGTVLNKVALLVNQINTIFSNLDDDYYRHVQCSNMANRWY